jgi:hypothetical protein
LSAELHHKGYDDDTNETENAFYIERAGENKMEEFGFDEETNQKSACAQLLV